MDLKSVVKIEEPKLKVESVASCAITTRKAKKEGGGQQATTVTATGSVQDTSWMRMVQEGESITQFLFFGTNDGCISQYRTTITLENTSTSQSQFAISSQVIQARRSLDVGKSSPVTQLQVDTRLKEPRLIALCNGTIMMIHIERLDRMPVFNSTKDLDGAQLFCITEGADMPPRLAALVKKRIFCVTYSESACSTFVAEETQPFVMNDTVLQMAWHYNSLLVCSPKAITIFDTLTHQRIDQIVVDKASITPSMRWVPIDGGKIACTIGSTISLYDGKKRGALDTAPTIQMSEEASKFLYSHPFHIALTVKGGVLLKSTLDNMELPQVTPSSMVLTSRGEAVTPPCVYIATAKEIFALVNVPNLTQVGRLIALGAYDRAIAHFEKTTPENDLLFSSTQQKIHTLCAFEAFARKQDVVAFQHFEQSDAPLDQVVALFPALIRKKEEEPHAIESQMTAARQRAKSLVFRRNLVAAAESSTGMMNYELLYNFIVKRRVQSEHPGECERIVDYALLKMFALGLVQFTVDDIAKLFLPTNALIREECEPLLESPLKPELYTMLLATHGEYDRALEICRDLSLVESAVTPLQLSGNSRHYSEHLPWMVIADPRKAVKAVTMPTKNPPAPELVLSVLSGCTGQPLREYLHYAITTLKNKDPKIHTAHAINLIKMVQVLMRFSGSDMLLLNVPPGMEPGLLGELRSSLLNFLGSSTLYDSDTVLAAMEGTNMLHEQTVVYSRDKDDTAALEILVYKLHDVAAAETFCVQRHEGTLSSVVNQGGAGGVSSVMSTGSMSAANFTVSSTRSVKAAMGNLLSMRKTTSTVDEKEKGTPKQSTHINEHLTTLVKVLLAPPLGEQPKLDEALEILERRSREINPTSVLAALPPSVNISTISPYLVRVFQSGAHRKYTGEVAVKVAESMHFSAKLQHSVLQQRAVFVDEDRTCCVCNKRLGDAIIGVFPNLKVAHFRCAKEKNLDPERGVPFRSDFFY